MKSFLSILLAAFLLSSTSSCAQKTQKENKSTVIAKTSMHPKDLSGYSKATFASGCFWCVEAAFESVKGVKEAISGYAGGTESNPTYEEVGSGSTGHAESVEVYYDPKEITYETLLKVYFASMDPTQVNGQGPDRGRQYRSIIFYNNPAEKAAAEKYIAELNGSGKYKAPISVDLDPFTKFWNAEGYHQNYVEINPTQGYVMGESIPRIKRFQAQFPDLIKDGHKF